MSSERVFIIAGKRSAVAPRSGAFASLTYYDLAAQVVIDILKEAKIDNSKLMNLLFLMLWVLVEIQLEWLALKQN